MEKIRLSKLMSELGLCSRREADEYIERGWVLVDGERVTALGTKVDPAQTVTLDEHAIAAQSGRVTMLLNKPIGYVSGTPEKGYKAAIILITKENQYKGDKSGIKFSKSHLKNLAPAGRLDIDSQGLIVFTQDGRTAKLLIGKSSDIEKEYLVRVQGMLDAAGLRLLNHGLSLDGAPLKPAEVSWQNADQLRFVLKEGKKRQIRRMCEQVGLKVTGLKRIRIGEIKLENLQTGKWRYLSAEEHF